MKKITVGGLPGNVLGMLADLMLKLQNGVITPGQLAKFCKKENPFNPADHSEEIFDWELLYGKFFGKVYDFSNIIIPEKPNVGRWRLLIITNLTLEQLYAKCKELFPCWRWTDENLDKKVAWKERDAKNGAYAIWVKDEVEADVELKNISVKDIKEKNIKAETLAERLIHELKFFDETGKHLDIKNVTLCSGSRYVNCNAPLVRWYNGNLRVGWYGQDGASSDSLRFRQVVS